MGDQRFRVCFLCLLLFFKRLYFSLSWTIVVINNIIVGHAVVIVIGCIVVWHSFIVAVAVFGSIAFFIAIVPSDFVVGRRLIAIVVVLVKNNAESKPIEGWVKKCK